MILHRLLVGSLKLAFARMPPGSRGYCGTGWVSTREDILRELVASYPEYMRMAVDDPERMHVTLEDRTVFVYRLLPDDPNVMSVIGQKGLFLVRQQELTDTIQSMITKSLLRSYREGHDLGFVVEC